MSYASPSGQLGSVGSIAKGYYSSREHNSRANTAMSSPSTGRCSFDSTPDHPSQLGNQVTEKLDGHVLRRCHSVRSSSVRKSMSMLPPSGSLPPSRLPSPPSNMSARLTLNLEARTKALDDYEQLQLQSYSMLIECVGRENLSNLVRITVAITLTLLQSPHCFCSYAFICVLGVS